MTTIAVLTTTSSLAEAKAIAHALVERSLAACVQISEIESVYRWEGAVQQDSEYRLLVKTTETRYEDVEAAIRELHSYELPAICAFDFRHTFEPYADWVAENSRSESR